VARSNNADLEERLSTFVSWVKDNLTGDEKGQAQIFLDHFFRALGHGGVPEAGAVLEKRVRKAGKQHPSYADLVWKPIVLIEMKRRGENLTKHWQQARDYWIELAPGRPRYVVLCNFDEFWIYDFETQPGVPVDKLLLDELPNHYGPLTFMLPQPEPPVFGNDHEAASREAADKLSTLFRGLLKRKVERDLAQRFVLQSLMALFAEDIGLLERYAFARILEDCKTPADTHDLIGGLFTTMATPGGAKGGRFKGVPYFNGGLFAEPALLEVDTDELVLLREASAFDWSNVQPEIFGAIFEQSLNADDRHAYGAYYTSPGDIMKIVGPTIVTPWSKRIESAGTLTELKELLNRIERFHVLDPACGSGNFLYIAYRELKRLEARIYERMAEDYKSIDDAQRPIGFVTARNFHGLDINPFAVELAKATMMLARKLAIDELHVVEKALPLDNLNENYRVCDALIDENGERTPWPRADVIIGNPPFLGAKRLKPERGVDYVNELRALYPEVPGMADYCVYWLRRSNDHLPKCTLDAPLVGRAGLVGTQNIRNNQSRVGGLDHIVDTGTIIEAVDDQPWSGEANVHVSIVNWVKTESRKLIPAKKRLWSKVDEPSRVRARRRRGTGPAAKEYELTFRDSTRINSSLSDQTDVSGAAVLSCNTHPKVVFQGITPGHSGFVLTHKEKKSILDKDRNSAEVVFPYLIGRELVTGDGTPERFVIDFQQRDVLECQRFKSAFSRVETLVLDDRKRKAEQGRDAEGNIRPHHKQFVERWWQLSWSRAEMVEYLKSLSGRFIACSRVTKRPIFVFVSNKIRPGDKLQAFLFDDDYSYGILQSDVHWQWFVAKGGRLKSDFSYTPKTVFDTFPWPQSPSASQIESIASAGREIRAVRDRSLESTSGGLRAVYRTLELPGKNPLRDAHVALDKAVLKAYGFRARGDVLDQLLKLNLGMARRIGESEPVTAPGVPLGYKKLSRLVSSDCIGAA